MFINSNPQTEKTINNAINKTEKQRAQHLSLILLAEHPRNDIISAVMPETIMNIWM